MANTAALKLIAEHIHITWDEALANNDIEKLLSLYAPDAILESPVIRHLLGTATGICRDRQTLRLLLEKVVERKPPMRKYFKKNYLTDGKTVMWEYPRATPDGEQMDFVEVMEIKDQLIQHHRIYWGWYGFKVLQENQYHN